MKSVLFLLALIFVAGCVQTTTTAPATTVPATTTAQATTVVTTVLANATTATILAPKEVAVNITAAGFNPSSVEINKGDTVVWTNKGTAASWPASAVHPTHKVYPGSDTAKCGTAEASGIFDACKGLTTGEKFSFKFDHNGTWGYHDHLNAGNWGTVVVK